MMAAVILDARGLRLQDAETPALGTHDVRVRVHAGGIRGSDPPYHHGGGFGAVRIREPLIPGHEIAGEVAQTGAAAKGPTL